MDRPPAPRTLGVVVVHEPGGPAVGLAAVRGLAGQVDQLLLVANGHGAAAPVLDGAGQLGIRTLCFDVNRGTAAAWNAALAVAAEGRFRYLYLLDQDSTPASDAVAVALAAICAEGVAAVVQPAAPDRFGLDPFPWNTVASGSLYDVEALRRVGGFDERLFVDEVDHELLARLVRSGDRVRPLVRATIAHQTGTPRDVRVLGQRAVVSGHGEARRRVQGFSAGVLIRRYLHTAPATAARLLLRHGLTAAKDAAAKEQRGARALWSGLAAGAGTPRPPTKAAERACPYCAAPLLGRFGDVPDWLFRTGASGDVYQCAACGALAAGRVPDQRELASWYAEYYTHSPAATRPRVWSQVWPTPRRRREMERLRWYFASADRVGRFLEVGTGSGERLVQFADAGWDVQGQDPDPKAGHLARDRGIKVHTCAVDELVGAERPFDLIGLSHVLEHVVDPRGLLRACASLLAPGGQLCVVSPNAESLGRLLFGRWWYGLDQPRHLAIPTLRSLRRAADGLGLRTTRLGSVATNGAVMLGGSLGRGIEARLGDRRVGRGAAFSMHLLGQALGRAAVEVDPRRGEEVVWVAQRPG